MWLCAILMSIEYAKDMKFRPRYYICTAATFLATLGVFLAGDFFTCFIFFELMSIISYGLVIHGDSDQAMKAGETYLAVAVIGGMITLMGLFLFYSGRGSKYLCFGLMVFGFMTKAGVFPAHIWLPKAHPVAPAPASALLSGILTKAGVLGMYVISTGYFIGDHAWGKAFAILGMITMLTGAVLALFSVNMKRILACSSVSQIGFITTGIGFLCLLGEENEMAQFGSILHMVNHSMIKLVLFLGVGAVYMKAHSLDLNDLKGKGKRMPWLIPCFAVGALSISGVPGFSGYVSKTFLHEAIVEYMEFSANSAEFVIFEKLFLLTGGLTFAYMLKLFICLFVEGPKADASGKAAWRCRWTSIVSVVLPALVLIVLGILYMPRTTLHDLKGALISLSIGAAVYLIVVRRILCRKLPDGTLDYRDLWPEKLDLEQLVYRPVIAFLVAVFSAVFRFLGGITDAVIDFLRKGLLKQYEPGERRRGLADRFAGSRAAGLWHSMSSDFKEFTTTLTFGLVSGLLGFCIFLLYLLFR